MYLNSIVLHLSNIIVVLLIYAYYCFFTVLYLSVLRREEKMLSICVAISMMILPGLWPSTQHAFWVLEHCQCRYVRNL